MAELRLLTPGANKCRLHPGRPIKKLKQRRFLAEKHEDYNGHYEHLVKRILPDIIAGFRQKIKTAFQLPADLMLFQIICRQEYNTDR
jgi:hypothetical protein